MAAYALRAPYPDKWPPWRHHCRLPSNRIGIPYPFYYSIPYRQENKAIKIIIKKDILHRTICRFHPVGDFGFTILEVVEFRELVSHTYASRNP